MTGRKSEFDKATRTQHTKIIPYFLYYSVSLALGRMLVGVVYIATFQVVCGLFFNHQYMLTDEFMVSYMGREQIMVLLHH